MTQTHLCFSEAIWPLPEGWIAEWSWWSWCRKPPLAVLAKGESGVEGGIQKSERFLTIVLRICHFGMWTTLSWKQSRPCGHKRSIWPSRNCLKDLQLGSYHMARQISNYQTSLSSYGPRNCPPPLWSPRSLSHSVAQDGIDTILPSSLWISHVCGVLVCTKLHLLFSC